MEIITVKKDIVEVGDLIKYLQTLPQKSEVFIHGKHIDSIVENLTENIPFIDIRGE